MKIRKIHNCTGHRAALYALAAGKDDRHVLTAGGDGWIVEWALDQPETGMLVASVESQVFSLCRLPGEARLVAGNMSGGIHWIDLAKPTETRNIQHHQKGVFDIAVCGDYVMTAGGEGAITRWDRESAKSLESLHLSNQSLRCIAVSAQNDLLAIGGSDHSIYILDAQTLEIRRHLEQAHHNSVFSLAFSPDGRHLWSGGRDAMLRIWDVENDFLPVKEVPAHLNTINHIVFSPDGQLAATASRDRTIRIWDAENAALLKVIETVRDGGHHNSVNRLLWLQDVLLSCSDDRTMSVWAIEGN
ncbi:MAG: WD40 repeat domain-containing protein [Lewinellaceae bacterium]|nr:WD40 repeat domain-containing protein [Lewinellaceae bacterium]